MLYEVITINLGGMFKVVDKAVFNRQPVYPNRAEYKGDATGYPYH